jgi:hypothetical protein
MAATRANYFFASKRRRQAVAGEQLVWPDFAMSAVAVSGRLAVTDGV